MAAMDARLTDYLNDKLQTYTDFDELDALIANVEQQQALLRSQLDEAVGSLATKRETAEQHARQIKSKAAAFEKQQGDIERRLAIVTQSDTTEDAIPIFEASMAQLQSLELAQNYIEMLQQVNRTVQDGTDKLKTSANTAVASYNLLYNLSQELESVQERIEGAAPHLVDYVRRQSAQIRSAIADVFASDLQKLLEKILWPKPGVLVPEALLNEWNDAVAALLSLQKPELRAQLKKRSAETSTKPPVLLLFEVLVRPLEARFQYHFHGDRPTNKLDKPEFFLSHLNDLLAAHNDFVIDFIQPQMLRAFRGTELASSACCIDATSCFITALLPMVRSKLAQVVRSSLGSPQLLSHLIYELISFDKVLEDEWSYSPGFGWNGLAWEVLVEQGAFEAWLQAESTFALKRYQAIIDDKANALLDYDSLAPGASKPTKAAYQILSLIETITERYRPLKSFSQKLKFLIDIQIAIYDRFHAYLQSGLDAYMSMTSSIGRTVQGVSAAETASLQGVSGLDRLCRIFGSADYLESAMREASDDVFFLDLWYELQDRAAQHDSALIGDLSVSDVAEKTSSTLVADGEGATGDSDTGALFDETAEAYARLRARSEQLLVEAVTSNMREQLRPYTRSNAWSTQPTSPTSENADIAAPSSDLAQPLEILRTALTFLHRALSPLTLRRITKQITHFLDTYIFDRVLLVHSFSAHGASQVRFDIQALTSVIGDAIGLVHAEIYMRRCVEAAGLLTLEEKPDSNDDDDGDEDGPSAWEEGSNGDTVDNDDGLSQPGIWQVERALFASNESARAVLDRLRIEKLSENEARKILGRRIGISR